jgi:hypothetical protein
MLGGLKGEPWLAQIRRDKLSSNVGPNLDPAAGKTVPNPAEGRSQVAS